MISYGAYLCAFQAKARKDTQMGESSYTVSKRRLFFQIGITSFFSVLAVIVCYVLFFSYTPQKNALGAFASVCMDVICMLLIFILVMNQIFEHQTFSKTTRLFLGLMVGTYWALFLDFMTWSSDGKLTYDSLGYVYTVLSLCMGSALSFVFILYFSNYLYEMYGMKKVLIHAKFLAAANIIAFVITFIFAIMKRGFVFVDGHYEIGAQYDIVTTIPVVTVFYIMFYAIRYVKVIGFHDVVAVSGYNVIMIAGALFEAANRVGTTFVGITVANVYIFVMLQNKVIDKAKRQQEELALRIKRQFDTLESMAGIYSYVNYVDVSGHTVRGLNQEDSEQEYLDYSKESHSRLNRNLYAGIEEDQKERFWEYTDISTLSERMAGENLISAEFHHDEEGWFRAHYIRIGEDKGVIDKVIYAIRNINEEKKNVEKWIIKSNMDELTGIYNRHAYEDDVTALENSKIEDNFVYVSMDVNSLKVINDTLGHAAGDEMIIGASECMKQCLGAYGKLYRTGGDEFVAIIYANETQLEKIKSDVEDVTAKWHGEQNDKLAISCGYVTRKECPNLSIREMSIVADKRMYEDKANYYQRRGYDRRGQRDAHVAIASLYNKVMKINITRDSYQIIDSNLDDLSKVNELPNTISGWFAQFAASGQLHPEDVNEFVEKTNLDSLRSYYKEGNTSRALIYRRKVEDKYVKVVMELIPANDYKAEEQTLFLYVRVIE